jgi:hypothetical protein
MTNINTYIAVGLTSLILLLGSGTYIGWHLYKSLHPVKPVVTNTITVTDPYWHHIADSLAALPPKEHIKWLPQDTLFYPDTIPGKIDTAAILKDYFAVYKYLWEKTLKDSVQISLQTTVTKNQPIAYDLKYKLLFPISTTTTIVDNSVHYNKYLQAGITVPIALKYINTTSIDAQYIFPKGYVGAGFQPYNGIISAKAGLTIFKIK